MDAIEITSQIKRKRSFLCVGLDPDLNRFPRHILAAEDPIFEFNRQIIEATKDLCVAYKPNLAFYEAQGLNGLRALEKTLEVIPAEHFVIADAKRGDIGNTSRMYAEAFFKNYSFDAVTVAPYMGEDSVAPFLSFPGKWVILLALTSNKGSQDFQFLENTEGKKLYEEVLDKATHWGNENNLMFVIGATHPEQLAGIRKRLPAHFFLIPGVGAQGGSLEEVASVSINEQVGILVNSSRGILYAGNELDFAERAREAAQNLQQKMELILKERNFN